MMTVFSMSVVAAPQASAASAGDLIKMDGLSSVYYLGADGKRYVFPNEQTYFSWYSDFSSVVTISQSELESYSLGKNVTIRPGTKLVKITTDPKVYTVTPGGKLLWVPSEEVAVALYGENWASRVIDVPDAFFTNYDVEAGQASATALPAGTLAKFGGSDIYYIDTDGSARLIVDEAAFEANRFKFDDVVDSSLAMPTAGSDITVKEDALSDTAQGAGGIAGAGTGVSVALASDTPASISVPENGARVPMAKINLTAANDGDVTVSSIAVKRIGLSTYSQMTYVWAEKDGVVVASKKSVNSNDEATLVFSPALVVGAGTTVSLDLLATLSSATGNIGLSVVSTSAVSTNGATVSGSFPVNGNLMAPISYSVANLAITDGATVTYTPKVGDENVELGKFTLGFNGDAKDVDLKSIMLKNNGTEDLANTTMNLYLEYNGDKVSSGAVVDGRFVTISFVDGFSLLKDDSSKVIYLKGDVIAKENTGTSGYTFVLNKSTDLVAFEKTTGFGVNVYNTTSTTNPPLADAFAVSTVQTQSGVVTISKQSSSPSDTTIVKGEDNTVLLANVRVDEAISADGLKLIYGSSASNATTTDQFENVRVYVNGLLVDSFDPSRNASALITKELSSSLSLNKGDNEVKVMVKAKTTATAGSAFFAKLDSSSMFDSQNPEYVSSGNAVSGGDISGTATGGIFTVQIAVLTTVRNDGYSANKAVVKGASDVTVGRFVLKASYDDIRVTSISLGANASTTADSSLNDAKLFVDGVQVGTTQNFGTSGATFSSLDFTVAKDTTNVIEVKLSFDSSATGGFQTTMTVNAQDSRGTAISSGNTATTTTFEVLAAGTLSVELGGDSVQAAILPATSDEQEIAQYKFTAIDDSATLTEINVANTSSSTAVVATNAADSLVSSVNLYEGSTLIDSTLFVNGLAKFMVNDKVIVPANGNTTLTVKVQLNPISNDAAATNKDIQLALVDVKFKSSAGTVTGPQTENIIANAFRVRKTVPTVATQSLPETLLTAGDIVVSKFSVTANASGDVSLKKVVLNYATTTNSSIAGLANNAVKIDGATKDVASVLDTSAKTLTITFATPEVIAAGNSKTFEVLATLSVSGSGSESVTTKIVEDASYATDGSGNFVWSDGASISTYTYSNGKRVPGLTTSTQVISK